MDFIHAEQHLNAGDEVVVNSTHQCNISLTTDAEFWNYKSGRQFRYHGGFFRMFPASVVVPTSGHWNVTLDLGGGAANISYSINYIKRS